MMLALDTSTSYAGLAIHDGESLLYEQSWRAGRHHSEQVLVEVARALQLIGTSVNALSAVAVARGPGSFTGVRVGLSLAKGLALGRSIPLFGVGTLDAMADNLATAEGPVRPIVEAGRQRWVTAEYRNVSGSMVRGGEMENVDVEGLVRLASVGGLICGELDPAARRRLTESLGDGVRLADVATSIRRAGFIAQRALAAQAAGDSGEPAAVDAVYVSRQTD
jgi:tRNA threonylcarbamoyladenosine biosynthesis protein TsaB